MNFAPSLSARWLNAMLWAIALIFAGFLIGLGSLVVGDLPGVERTYSADPYRNDPKIVAAREALKAIASDRQDNTRRIEEARLSLEAAQSASRGARETFENWLRTRDATQRMDQDPGLVARTEQLDGLKAAERTIEQQLEALNQQGLTLSARRDEQLRSEAEARSAVRERVAATERAEEFRVFAYRLAVTLPLLVVAAWLLLKHRHGRNWPFVWGFAFAAAFAFFVELVPYMPSYGAYVRYGVGAVLTFVLGRAAIKALQARRDRLIADEARPSEARREDIATEVALQRLSKGTCPGCERPVDLSDPTADYCPNCGIGLFNPCPGCARRKNAFERYCRGCGTPAAAAAAE